MIQPTLITLHPNEYYPFAVNLNGCNNLTEYEFQTKQKI